MPTTTSTKPSTSSTSSSRFRVNPGALAALAAATLLAACSSTNRTPPLEITRGTVFQNVTIVDTRDGRLSPRMTVVTDSGRITQIVAGNNIALLGTARSIDGQGRYLVPGYLDMHTHATAVPDRAPANFSLYLANGITGIREMAGSADIIARARKTNIDSAAGVIDAPEIVAVPGELMLGVNDPQAAITEVRKQRTYGADFIKLISANRASSLAILSEAKTQGLTVAGHLSPNLSAEDSSDAGWRSIEHLGSGMGFLLDCSANERAIRDAIQSGEGAKPVPFSPAYVNSPMLFRGGDVPLYARILDSYSDQKCNALARKFVRNDTWNVPTLIRVKAIEISDDPAFRSDPNLMYVNQGAVALWQTLGLRYATEFSRPAALTLRQYYQRQMKTVKLLKDNGAKMMTGSDSGGSGIWMIPGFSLHQEFEELVAAGLTPLQVLQMTTLNPAEFLHREATMGTVEVGKNADLVLLEGNPLDSVVNLARISGVMVKGRWLTREVLAGKLAEVARAASAPPPPEGGPAVSQPISAAEPEAATRLR